MNNKTGDIRRFLRVVSEGQARVSSSVRVCCLKRRLEIVQDPGDRLRLISGVDREASAVNSRFRFK
jgi:hypothetical protein